MSAGTLLVDESQICLDQDAFVGASVAVEICVLRHVQSHRFCPFSAPRLDDDLTKDGPYLHREALASILDNPYRDVPPSALT